MQRLSRQKNRDIVVHDYKTIIQNLYSRIEKDLSQNNIELIKKYDRVLVNESLADATRSKNLSILLSLTRLSEKDWIGTTKEDVENLVYNVNTKFGYNGQETNTTVDHKKILKRFYRWMRLGTRNYTEVGDPPETKWIKPKRVKDKIVREELISEEDLERLLRACGENLRDRAFIHCHIEAGTRPGEILNLRIKHVKFDEYGAVLRVDGKTGQRPVRLVKSTPDLANYLDKHPFKEDPDAPLWIMIGNTTYGKPMTYASARKRIDTIAEKASLEKRVYLNLFRHSEATTTANFLTEAQMRKRHGWSASSKMPARYVHLVNADVDDAMLEHYGVKKEKTKNETMPVISIMPDSVSFGNTEVSERSLPKTVTISNEGTSVLKINSIGSPSGFSVTDIKTPLDILPDESKTFNVIFAPITTGEKTGKIIISSNDIENPTLAISVDGQSVEKGSNDLGGGCLIATAAYGSELAPQVQLLREIRDNTVLTTSSGHSFMTGFNQLYYSFSPTVADWERQSPVFKEVVKAAITPMVSSLTLLQYADIDSEEEMLGYGIGIILLNVSMYFVTPALAVFAFRQKIRKN